MKSTATGALVLMFSLLWTISAMAFGSSPNSQRPVSHSPDRPGPLAENTLANKPLTLHESGKILISWERRELSRSHRVSEKHGNDRSLRSVIGTDTNNDGKASGHVIVNTAPEEDCGCTDDRLDPPGGSILRSVKPQAGTF